MILFLGIIIGLTACVLWHGTFLSFINPKLGLLVVLVVLPIKLLLIVYLIKNIEVSSTLELLTLVFAYFLPLIPYSYFMLNIKDKKNNDP